MLDSFTLFVVVQLLSCVRLCDPRDCSALGFSFLHYLPEFAPGLMSIESVMLSNHHPRLPPFAFAFNLSQHQGLFQSQLFISGGQMIGASASASVLPINIQGWFPLGLTGLVSLLSKRFCSLFQHDNLKASIFWRSAFFTVQLSYPHMTTGKAVDLTI